MCTDRGYKALSLHDNILLVQRVTVEEFGEVDDWVVRISAVVGIRARGLGVFSLHRIEMMRRPVSRFAESGRVLDRQVIAIPRSFIL